MVRIVALIPYETLNLFKLYKIIQQLDLFQFSFDTFPYETLNLFKLYKIFITLTRALNLKFIKPGSYLKIDAFWGFSGYESMFFHMFFLAALTRVSASGNLSFLDFFELSGCQYRYKLTIFNEINISAYILHTNRSS